MDVNKYYHPKRKIEPQVKKDWKKRYPEFCISQLPGPGIITNEKITSGYFPFVDDNYVVYDCSDTKKMDLYWGWGFFGALFFLSLIVSFNIGFNWELLQYSLMISPITLLPALWFFIRAYYMNRDRKMIFDRQRGLVQVPGSYWGRSQLIRFNELHVVIGLATRSQGVSYLSVHKNKTFADKYLGSGIMIPFLFAKSLQSWSYWVWYMDKNRPLPPGDALDPYREQDYERRKAEGFPEPLHPSYIKTPEYLTDEYFLMNEENKTIVGSHGMSLNDDKEAGKRNEEKKRKEQEEMAQRHWICKVGVKLIKIVKFILVID